jgi:hypothetical protein
MKTLDFDVIEASLREEGSNTTVAQREALVFADEHRRGSILAETSATNGELASIHAG